EGLIIPREAIQEENGKLVAYVKQGGQFERREVKVGATSHTQAILLGGVDADEEVALQRPVVMRAAQ
ncbi:MAG TPA: hypothetical protein VG672_21110, partial [Bryobacteraceae bacterium]|nr:hypothetical protein [Bryobacteraceae bacterium]